MEYQTLKFLQESFLSIQNICSWSLDSDLQLLYSNCPEQDYFSGMFGISKCAEAITGHFREASEPIVAVDSIGFGWIAVKQNRSGQAPVIHMLGPVFTVETTEAYIRKHIRRLRLAPEIADRLFHFISKVPTITAESAYTYACMLHFCVNQETVKPTQVEMWNQIREEAEQEHETPWGDTNWHGTWVSEQRFFDSVREGRFEGIRELGVGRVGTFGGGDPLRQAKNELIILTVLCSRAAILGGVSSEGGYNLQDYFINRIEASKSVSEARSLSLEMHRVFVQRVRKVRAEQGEALLVRACKEYVETHIFEHITVKEIQAEIGYTENYISRKFKSETGESLFGYINGRKMEMAKTILRTEKVSVADISDRLGYSSPSYFSSVFRKITGQSPVEYQEKMRQA